MASSVSRSRTSIPTGRAGQRNAGLLRQFASPKWTVAVFILSALGVLGINQGIKPTLALAPALSLFTLNLCASIATHPRFRSDFWLLVFHVALIGVVGLAVYAKLTYLDAQTSVTRGESFDGHLVNIDQGPLHPAHYQRLRFVNEEVVDEYPPSGDEYLTFNRVRWSDEQGNDLSIEIGDDHPLLLEGYRFYTSRSGFTLKLIWMPREGEMELGSMQLGPVDNDGWFSGTNWQLRNGPMLWLGMDYQVPEPKPGARRENLGFSAVNAPMVVRVGEERHLVEPGTSLVLPEGTLTFAKLDSWMGYRVVYDPTAPWLAGLSFIAVVSLIAFYSRRIFSPRRADSQ